MANQNILNVDRLSLPEVTRRYARMMPSLDVGAAERQMTELADAKAGMLPVEEYARQELSASFAALADEVASARFDVQYPRLEMSFMKRTCWSEAARMQVPAFAMFDLQSEECAVSVEARIPFGGSRYVTELESWPRVFAGLVAEDVADGLRSKLPGMRWRSLLAPLASKQVCASIRTEFLGVIPQGAKENIKHAKTLFRNVYLVTEAPAWSLEVVERPSPIADPLVVGEWNGRFWLVDRFDVTPLEEYIASEFTQKGGR